MSPFKGPASPVAFALSKGALTTQARAVHLFQSWRPRLLPMDSGGAFSAYRSVLHQAFKAPIATITAAISIQFCKCEWTPNGVNSPTSHWPMWSPKDIKKLFPGHSTHKLTK